MEMTMGMRIRECRVKMGMTQEMKNDDVRKVAIEQVKVLERLNKDVQVKKIKKEFTFSLLNNIIKAQK